MRMLRLGEVDKLTKQIEAIKSRNFNPLAQFEEIPSPIELGMAYLGHSLDAWQTNYLEMAPECSRIAIAASRQSGKSTVTALFVAWCLMFIPNFTCVVASRSLRQASYYLDKVREIVLMIIPRSSMPQLNRLSMELPNGSTIISIPCAQPDAGRGFSPHLILLDEAAFAPEALFTAITPSVAATHGAIHMISSPNGRAGRFFDAFEGKSRDVWTSQRVRWTDCPRITQDQMDIEKIAMGDLYWRQEFMAEFVQPMGAFFGHSALLSLEEEEAEDLTGLDLREMEAVLSEDMPMANPSKEDLRAALDTADRVNRLLYD